MGGRPERPEDYTLGERPEMPEDFAQGRRPEMTEDSQSGETPQNDLGSAMTPPYGSLDQDGPGSGMLKDAGRDVTEEIASSSALRLSDYSSKTWIWLGASAAVLIAGLLFAKRWRRY